MSCLLLVGGGGHCLTVIDSLPIGRYEKVGIVDTPDLVGQTLNGVEVVGCDEDIESLRTKYNEAFISLGSIGNWQKREEIAIKLKQLEYVVDTIIHSKAYVNMKSKLACGVLVGAGSFVNACADIGEMSILNTGSIIEHHCIIESYVHIAPGTVLCGNVRIGKGTHIGAGSVIREGVSVGQNVLIGIGSVVTKNIPDNVVAYGNPCEIRKEAVL